MIENRNGIEIGLQSTLHLISLVVDPVNWVEVPLDGVPGGDPPLADQEHPHAEEQDEDTRQVGVERYLAILQEFLIPGILLGYIEEKKFLKLTQFLFPFSLNPYRQGGETDHCIKRVL